MIQLSGINKSFGNQTLFEGAAFVLNRRERVGLAGRNGSGKSTLFKIILGEETIEDGTVVIPKGYRIGQLSQYLTFSKPTILEEAVLGLPEEERELTYKAEIILSGLGFSEADFARSPDSFSGGFQIRINLAKLLLSEPDLLLLDEPTNYLDIVTSRWLAETLRSWPGELIIITHDRSFMDSVTTHTALIHRGTIRKVKGSTEKLYEQVALEEEVYEKTRANEQKKRQEIEKFINRFRAKASKASLVQSRVKALEKMEVKEALTQEDSLEFQFAEKDFYGKFLLEARDLSFGYDKNLKLFKDLTFSVGKKDRIGIIGKNGRGKSTLLRVLASELQPLEGEVSLNPSTSFSYFGQTNVERLNLSRTIEEEITAAQPNLHRTKVRTICGIMMFEGDAALKKINVLSGGEKSRVLLGKIIATPSNLLLLDEPTNHLDMDSIESLLESLEVFSGALVLVTHDEELLRKLCTRLIVFQGDKPFVFEGTYDSFLSSIGWEEEGIKQEAKPTQKINSAPKLESNTGGTKQQQRDQRSKQKKIQSLESQIAALETQQKSLSPNVVADAAKSYELQQAIDKLLEELIELS